MAEVTYMTREGYNKLKAELEHMRAKERPAAAAAIAEARDKGDLSENAEYDAAKEAQAMLEMRIANMEATLAGARILDESNVNTDKIQILSRVKLMNHSTNKEVEYTIVSEKRGQPESRQAFDRHPHRPSPARQKRKATRSMYRYRPERYVSRYSTSPYRLKDTLRRRTAGMLKRTGSFMFRPTYRAPPPFPEPCRMSS